jgi:NADH-quinone oxidoreductase subunit M
MPLYALVFMVFTMANVGLPGTSGFVGEFLTLIGTFKVNDPGPRRFATLGVILSACYALWLYRKVVFGALTSRRWPASRISPSRDPDAVRRWWPHHPVRRLSEAGARHVGGLGAATRQQLQHRVTAVKAAALLQ